MQFKCITDLLNGLTIITYPDTGTTHRYISANSPTKIAFACRINYIWYSSSSLCFLWLSSIALRRANVRHYVRLTQQKYGWEGAKSLAIYIKSTADWCYTLDNRIECLLFRSDCWIPSQKFLRLSIRTRKEYGVGGLDFDTTCVFCLGEIKKEHIHGYNIIICVRWLMP